MTSEAAKREALLAGRQRDLEALRELRCAAGGTYAIGNWVKSWDGHLVGEVVEVRPREGGPAEYIVRAPKVAIETSHLHLVSGDDLKGPVRVEDSHIAMAMDHLEYVCDELLAAGLRDDAETIWAHLQGIAGRHLAPGAGPHAGGTDGCAGCGSFAHPSENCPGEE